MVLDHEPAYCFYRSTHPLPMSARNLQTLDSSARRALKKLTDPSRLQEYLAAYLDPEDWLLSAAPARSTLSKKELSHIGHLARSLRREIEQLVYVRCRQLGALADCQIAEGKKSAEMQQKRVRISELMHGAGYQESVHDCFGDDAFADSLLLDDGDVRRNRFTLPAPGCSEPPGLRTMLLPGLLRDLGGERIRDGGGRSFFEIGIVFQPEIRNQPPAETTFICGVSAHAAVAGHVGGRGSLHPPDECDAETCLDHLFEGPGLPHSDTADIKIIHPVQEGVEKFCEPDYALLVFAGGAFLGSLGWINSEVLRNFGIRYDVSYFELNFDALCEL